MSIGTNYFQNFPKKIYNNYIIVNLLNRAKIKNLSVLVNSKIYDTYAIKDGETPESIAEAYYGSTTDFWIILYANGIKNIYEDWPKSQDILDNYIIEKYGSLEYAMNAVHHYEDSEGSVIYQDYWEGDLDLRITLYDYELKINEAKRNINLIQNSYKSQLIREFQTIFNA